MPKLFILRAIFVLLLEAVTLNAASEEALRDPTLPLGHVAVHQAAAKLDLQAVFNRNGQREAIVNGQRVLVGAMIGQARILKINDKSLVYELKGRKHRLKLRTSVVSN